MADLINRVCPLCGGAASEPHWRKEALTLVRCLGCDMVYANPIEADLVSGAFYDRQGTSFYLSADKIESDYAPVRFQREVRLFQRFCPRGRVLDVGCSTGGFLHQLRQTGEYAVWGTDVVEDALQHAAGQGVEVVRGPFLDQDFGGRQFDAVTFWAVVEHLADPGAFLRKAADLLVEGGHLFVLVPNLGSLAIRLCGPKYRYVMPDHVNYFTATTLRALAARIHSLQPVFLGTSHFNPVVIWQDWRGAGRAVPGSERAALLRRTTGWKQRGWLKPVRAVYRLAEWSLARCGLADNLVLVCVRRGVASPIAGPLDASMERAYGHARFSGSRPTERGAANSEG